MNKSSLVIQKLEDGLNAVTSLIPPETVVTWLPQARNWYPAQCYVLRDQGQSLLIDGGLAVHREAIRDHVLGIMDGSEVRHGFITRREPDAIMNIPWLTRELDLSQVAGGIAGGGDSPMSFFEEVEDANLFAQFERTPGITLKTCPPGTVLPYGRFQLELIRTNLRILSTTWIFEHTTGTLFSTDSFSYFTVDGHDRLSPLTDPSEVDPLMIERYLSKKFDWVVGANTEELQQELIDLFGKFDVRRICPMYGRVIEGKPAVQAVLDATIAQMKKLSTQSADMRRVPAEVWARLERTLASCKEFAAGEAHA